jgi:hypothetical protein
VRTSSDEVFSCAPLNYHRLSCVSDSHHDSAFGEFTTGVVVAWVLLVQSDAPQLRLRPMPANGVNMPYSFGVDYYSGDVDIVREMPSLFVLELLFC